MDHLNPVDNPDAAPPPDKSKDPVCGMDVYTATARFKTVHNGKEYFFCCAPCLAKFQANPEKILSTTPTPMGSGLVSLGGTALVKPLVMPTMGKPVAPNAQLPGASGKDTRTYVCPMCPEVRQIGPGPCPKCGMALDPELLALPATKREYTCPMHPQIVRSEPGNCPICGMTLEPRVLSAAEEKSPELSDMTRRFWISIALAIPLIVIEMSDMIPGQPLQRVMPDSMRTWLELVLATPVVLWAG